MIVNPPHLSTLLPALKKVSSFNKDRVSLDNEALVEIREEGEGGERGEGGRGGQLAQRRTKLPCPTPDMADFSLWTILRKNIGTVHSQRLAVMLLGNVITWSTNRVVSAASFHDLPGKKYSCIVWINNTAKAMGLGKFRHNAIVLCLHPQQSLPLLYP